MQSIFRLPWSTEPHGMDKVTFQKPRPVPVVEIPVLKQLKRKRTDSPEASPASSGSAHLGKKWKCADGEVKPAVSDVMPANPASDSFAAVSPAAANVKTDRKPVATFPNGKENVRPKSMKPSKEASSGFNSARTNGTFNSGKPSAGILPVESPTMAGCMTRKQQILEQEFNMAMLVKHDELRVIEQELAKCQVALEQLRRCHLVPFPGANGLSENVSLGVGPALKPQPGYTRPEAPVPWGIMDGPYTRHYAKWLIPDPKFDSVPKSSASAYAGMHFYGVEGGRSTRGSLAFDHLGSKSRGTRTSSAAGLKLTGLGENPPPAPKMDPLIHKRSTDGQWVKLYCAECKSDKFSNTQGFLNHCRIKHNLVFKSHDAAAIACGIPIDIEEASNGGTVALPQTATDTAAPTPAAVTAAPVVVGPTGSVHPLIRSTPASASKQMPPRRVPPPKTTSGATPGTIGPVDSYFSTPVSAQQTRNDSFVASPQTPYMSELLSKRGFLGNLKDIVEEARAKIDLDSIDSPTSDDDSAQATPVLPSNAAGARLPASFGGIGMQRPGSQKGQQLDPVRIPPSRGALLPLPPSLQSMDSTDSEASERVIPESPLDLSPNTVESNPGLVSDCEDDDDDDDARSVPQLMDIDEPMNIVVEDGSDVESGRRKGVSVHRVHAEHEGLCAATTSSPSKKSEEKLR